jgi:putative membrane protein
MRRIATVLLALGFGLIVVLLARAETGDILVAFASLGLGGFAAMLVLHAGLIGLMGVAWCTLADTPCGPFVSARLLRDAAAEVLPLSQIGGFVLGARALVLSGIPAGVAAATTVVDVTAELAAQLVYTVLGVALLAWLRPGSPLTAPALAALGAMAVLAGLFVAAQRGGAVWIDRLLERAARVMMGARESGGTGLGASLHHLHAHPARLAAGFGLHLTCWLLVGGETWIILHLMAVPVSLAAALVIDSLVSGLRSVAFMVPQALGVQEGGYIMLGALFGLAPETALALSLARRARDVAIGVPVLLTWQVVEARRSARR